MSHFQTAGLAVRDVRGVQIVQMTPQLRLLDARTARQLRALLAGARAKRIPTVLTGTGDVFAAGPPAGFSTTDSREVWRLVAQLRRHEEQTVAAINGDVYGWGIALALACRYSLAVPWAGMSLSLTRPELAAQSRPLLDLVATRMPQQSAQWWAYTNTRIGAEKAVELGLINEVPSDPSHLLRAAMTHASRA